MADEKDIADGDGDASGGGKKKLLIIGGIALVLLFGAGGAAFLLLGGEPPADGSELAGQAPAEVDEGDPVYHKLAPEFIVNLPPGGSVKMLQIALQVMTRTPSVVETLQANDPMIRHHLINLFEGQQASALLTVEGKQALQQEVHELLSGKLEELKEPGKIRGVYFTQFVMQ